MKKKNSIIAFLLLASISFSLSAQTIVRMNQEKGGVYTAPCKVNGLSLKFIYDANAMASISLSEAIFMLRNGYLNGKDVVYSDPNIPYKAISENSEIVLREIEVGGIKLQNVKTRVVRDMVAPVVLGQSIFQQVGIAQVQGSDLLITPHNIYNQPAAPAYNNYDYSYNQQPINHSIYGQQSTQQPAYQQQPINQSIYGQPTRQQVYKSDNQTIFGQQQGFQPNPENQTIFGQQPVYQQQSVQAAQKIQPAQQQVYQQPQREQQFYMPNSENQTIYGQQTACQQQTTKCPMQQQTVQNYQHQPTQPTYSQSYTQSQPQQSGTISVYRDNDVELAYFDNIECDKNNPNICQVWVRREYFGEHRNKYIQAFSKANLKYIEGQQRMNSNFDASANYVNYTNFKYNWGLYIFDFSNQRVKMLNLAQYDNNDKAIQTSENASDLWDYIKPDSKIKRVYDAVYYKKHMNR